MRRAAPVAFLALAVGYVVLHVIAAALGIPPSRFFAALFEAAGFAAGCVAFLLLVFQLTRR